MPATLHIEDRGRYLLFTLEADEELEWSQIDTLMCPRLNVISDKPIIYKRNAKIDLGSVELSFMLRIHKLSKMKAGQMLLCEMGAKEKELLMITALDQLWAIFPTLQEAEESISS